jgi:hypothetical protein
MFLLQFVWCILYSDHAIISISLEEVFFGSTRRTFHMLRYGECWAKDDKCENLVRVEWDASMGNCALKSEFIQPRDNKFTEYRTNEI